MLLRERTVPIPEFEAGTGWAIRPEGACRGDVCIPLRDIDPSADGTVDAYALAEQMGLPVVHDDTYGVGAIGPWSANGRALAGADAPELVLPDVHGDEFRLSSLRGQKVLILSWAPY